MRFIVLMVVGFFMTVQTAGATDINFSSWLNGVNAEARSKGISEATLNTALKKIELLPRVMELSQKQPEFTLTYDQYIEKVVPDNRVAKAKALAKEHAVVLDKIHKQFGVQPKYIIALWGIESNFGEQKGGFSVLSSLATLAYESKRKEYFRGELLQALKIIDEGHITADDMKGSWAGAMGQNQFMPTSFLKYAVDFDGDNHKNIWTSTPDVLASIASYLSTVGWNQYEKWGREVKVPATFDPAISGRKNKKTLDEWTKLGVTLPGGQPLPDSTTMAAIILPEEGKLDHAYIVYDNFNTIMDWNRSLFFATAVGRLADKIEG